MQHVVIYNSGCIFPRDSMLHDLCCVSVTTLRYVRHQLSPEMSQLPNTVLKNYCVIMNQQTLK